MAPRKRSEIMAEVHARIAKRKERKLSREGAWKQRIGIVADTATNLPADRKSSASHSNQAGLPRNSGLSAGRNSGEGAN